MLEHYFTPDEWPQVYARLKASGITNFERYHFDLNHPEKGWQLVTPTTRQVYQQATRTPQ